MSMIDSDLPCLACDYNLRGLVPEGRCPECGHPIERTLRDGDLSHAAPVWLRQVAGGARWISAGMMLILLMGLLLLALGLAPFGQASVMTEMYIMVGLLAAGLVQVCLYLAGMWAFTHPEPKGMVVLTRSQHGARWLSAGAYFAGLVTPLAAVADPLVSAFFAIVCVGLAVAGLMAALRCVEAIAARYPRGSASHRRNRRPVSGASRFVRYALLSQITGWSLLGILVFLLPLLDRGVVDAIDYEMVAIVWAMISGLLALAIVVLSGVIFLILAGQLSAAARGREATS